MANKQSDKFSLNKQDVSKIIKGAAIAFGAAASLQISMFISTGVVFDWKVWSVSIVSVGINAVWKFLQSPK